MHSGRGDTPINLYCYACDMDLMLFDENDDTSANNTTDDESNSDSMEMNNRNHGKSRKDISTQSIHHTRSNASSSSVERAARRGIPPTEFPPPSV